MQKEPARNKKTDAASRRLPSMHLLVFFFSSPCALCFPESPRLSFSSDERHLTSVDLLWKQQQAQMKASLLLNKAKPDDD